MKTPDEIKKGLLICGGGFRDCAECPYHQTPAACMKLSEDALEYILQLEFKLRDATEDVKHLENQLADAGKKVAQLETRGWELFDRLSSAWYWKGCYSKQDDGTVYSKASCQYLSFDQAIDEFATALTNAYEVE